MKVLHVIKLDPRAPGGIERFADELMTAQAQAGLDVHAVGCSSRDAARHDVPYGLSLARTWLTVFHLPLAPGFPRAIAAAIARLRPDVVHVHWPNPLVLDLAGAIPRGTRLVLHWHADIDPAGASLPIRVAYALAVRRYEARLCVRADAIVATSHAYARSSPVLARVPDKVCVVPLGLREMPRAAPASWPLPGRPRVLFVGRAVPYKSLEVLLGALRRVADASLVVVGDGPERARWEQAAQVLGVTDRLRFTGTIDEPAKQSLLAACDVLCLPSSNRLEAFGIVLLEAAAAGRPVIAAEVPGSGMAEVAGMIPGSSTFPVGDVEALAERLRRHPVAMQPGAVLPAAFRIEAVAAAIAAIYARTVAA